MYYTQQLIVHPWTLFHINHNNHAISNSLGCNTSELLYDYVSDRIQKLTVFKMKDEDTESMPPCWILNPVLIVQFENTGR